MSPPAEVPQAGTGTPSTGSNPRPQPRGGKVQKRCDSPRRTNREDHDRHKHRAKRRERRPDEDARRDPEDDACETRQGQPRDKPLAAAFATGVDALGPPSCRAIQKAWHLSLPARAAERENDSLHRINLRSAFHVDCDRPRRHPQPPQPRPLVLPEPPRFDLDLLDGLFE